jgi:alkyldihydroxyacetonephosphate synthase
MSIEAISWLDDLRKLVGAGKVSVDSESRAARAHDFWLLDFQRRLHGQAPTLPACVVKAEKDSDVEAVLKFAQARGIAVVPFGAGSGVVGGVRPGAGAIVLDLSAMKRLVEINEIALTATVQAGMLGKDFECALNCAGYSMGHFPQSMNLSSVGGWVATRASGQFSSKYGSIEDMLVCLTGYLADGTRLATRNVPRSSTGPSVNELVLGSEGTLAVVTDVTYKIHPLPEKQTSIAYQFADFAVGLEAVRKIMRAGIKPALVRLYDAVETKRHFADVAQRGTCVLLLLSEGLARLADLEIFECAKICKQAGAVDLGPGPVHHWLEKRFQIPNLSELAESKGVVFDTIEVAANWDRIHNVYNDAIAGLNKIPGIVNASAHSSHSYAQGTCLYFTFAVKKPKWWTRQAMCLLGVEGLFSAGDDLPYIEQVYNGCWKAVSEAALKNQGTISHHHGVGKVRLPWIERELGSSYAVLAAVKRALDPSGILNPGTFFKGEETR